LCVCCAAGDALHSERERAESLEETTAVLQKRIVNMASVRETSNKQLTGQLSQLKEKLAASRRQQQESAAQVGSACRNIAVFWRLKV
jgi:ribosomal protein L29